MPYNFESLDVDTATNNFTNWCISIADKYFPLCSKKVGMRRIKAPWLCKSAIKCLNLKTKLYFQCKRGEICYEMYFLFSEILKRLLKLAKEQYYRKLFSNNKKSSKKTWNNINTLVTGGKDCDARFQIKKNGNLISSPIEIANEFNEYFLNIPTDLYQKLTPSKNDYSYLIDKNPHSIFFQPATTLEVFNIINSIKSKSSLHDIPIKMLQLSDVFSYGISELFNHIISCGVYPKKLKIATVIPIYKSGSKFDLKNYRPISLLPVLDKIFERLILTRLLSFFN